MKTKISKYFSLLLKNDRDKKNNATFLTICLLKSVSDLFAFSEGQMQIIFGLLIFLIVRDLCGLTDFPASNYDIKTDTPLFDTINNIL